MASHTREVDPVSSTRDERLWLEVAHSDTEPGTTYLFDRNKRAVTEQYKVREKLPRNALSPMKARPAAEILVLPYR